MWSDVWTLIQVVRESYHIRSRARPDLGVARTMNQPANLSGLVVVINQQIASRLAAVETSSRDFAPRFRFARRALKLELV